MKKYRLLKIIFFITFQVVANNLEPDDKAFWGNDGFSKDNTMEAFSFKENIDTDGTLETIPTKSESKRGSFYEEFQETGNKYKNLKDIELIEKVNSLKESIFELKSKLFLLSEATFKNTVIASGLKIIQDNELPDIFRGESIAYVLDGEEIFTEAFIEKEMPSTLNIYDKILSPGFHEIKILINLTGKGEGIYSYLNDYVFTLQSKKAFSVVEGKQTQLTIELKDSSSFMKSLNNRPKINYEIAFKDIDNKKIAQEVTLSNE